MLDTLIADDWEDFAKRYNHTFCWLLRGTEKIFIYINNINEDKIEFSTGGTIKYTALADSGVTFEFIPVDRGWYNTSDGDIVYLTRVPERQWRRGISINNTMMRNSTLDLVPLSYAVLSAVFKSTTKQTPLVFTPDKSMVLSKHFAWSAPCNSLLFHDVFIGTFEDHMFHVRDEFIQEVTDVFRRNNLGLGIKRQ